MLRAVFPGLALLALAGCRAGPPSVDFAATGHRSVVRTGEDVVLVGLEVDEVRERERRGTRIAEVRVRIEVENQDDARVALVPEELVLVDGDGVPFGPARLRRDSGGSSPEVAPGASEGFDVLFPYGPGERLRDRDLELLRLRWALAFDGGLWREEVVFERAVLVEEHGWSGGAVLRVHR